MSVPRHGWAPGITLFHSSVSCEGYLVGVFPICGRPVPGGKLLGQLASSPRKTRSTGFLFLFLCLLGWGKRLSLRFDPPLPSLPALPRSLGPSARARTCPGRQASRSAGLDAPIAGGAGDGAAWLPGLRPDGETRAGGGGADCRRAGG